MRLGAVPHHGCRNEVFVLVGTAAGYRNYMVVGWMQFPVDQVALIRSPIRMVGKVRRKKNTEQAEDAGVDQPLAAVSVDKPVAHPKLQ